MLGSETVVGGSVEYTPTACLVANHPSPVAIADRAGRSPATPPPARDPVAGVVVARAAAEGEPTGQGERGRRRRRAGCRARAPRSARRTGSTSRGRRSTRRRSRHRRCRAPTDRPAGWRGSGTARRRSERNQWSLASRRGDREHPAVRRTAGRVGGLDASTEEPGALVDLDVGRAQLGVGEPDHPVARAGLDDHLGGPSAVRIQAEGFAAATSEKRDQRSRSGPGAPCRVQPAAMRSAFSIERIHVDRDHGSRRRPRAR